MEKNGSRLLDNRETEKKVEEIMNDLEKLRRVKGNKYVIDNFEDTVIKSKSPELSYYFINVVENKLYELTIYECRYKSVTCYLVESGMGKVNAARTTQVLIDNMNVDYILNVGVAGSVSKNINKCDIVVADMLVQHDFDLRPLNFEKGLIPNVGN